MALFQFKELSRCSQYRVGKDYYEELGPILKLAVLRSTDKKLKMAKASSPLVIPVVLQVKLTQNQTHRPHYDRLEWCYHPCDCRCHAGRQ